MASQRASAAGDLVETELALRSRGFGACRRSWSHSRAQASAYYVYPSVMPYDEALKELKLYASTTHDGLLNVYDAAISLDERRDGEAITKVALLLDDPDADTWGFEMIQALRAAIARKGTELGLPRVSLTLVPRSEADLVPAFSA